MVNFSGGVGVSAIPTLPMRVPPTPLSLSPAQSYLVPAGKHAINPGAYSELQQFDQYLGIWRKAQAPYYQWSEIESDGANWRLFNTTGCAVAAMVTNGGTSYTSAPTVTANFGGSLWQAIVGGSINTTVTVTTAGGYNYIPTLVFSDPPIGGVRASATVSLSGGGLGTVTVVNAGAGYTTAPTITIVADPRETGTQGGKLTVNATLANVGVVTAVICLDSGNAVSTSVPTLTFAGGGGTTSASATAIMNFVVTGWTVGTVGSSLGTSLPLVVTSLGYKSTATVATTSVDPQLDVNVAFQRQCWLIGATNSTGGIIASNTSLTTVDNGWGFQQTPSLIVISNFAGTGAIAPTITAVVGGVTDTLWLQRLGT